MLVVGQTNNVVDSDFLLNQPLPALRNYLNWADNPPSTNEAIARGPSGKYLKVLGLVGSPYLSAKLYDDATNVWTTLTISGAMEEAANQNDGTLFLAYSDEQSKYYLKTSGAKKFYPLTLSGTTLTIGTAVDISAAFAGVTGTIAMVGDRTDLWFLDTAGVLKVYDLSGASMSTAKAVPNLSGFALNVTYWKLHYANGYIWLFGAASAATTAVIGKMQKYDIAGNSWSTPTTPSLLTKTDGYVIDGQWSTLTIYVDPTISTHFYVFTYSSLYKYTVTTGQLLLIYNFGAVNAAGQVAPAYYRNTNIAMYRAEACDFSRAFGFWVSTNYPNAMNPLYYLSTTKYTRISGEGFLSAVNALPYAAVNASVAGATENAVFVYAIDGGAPVVFCTGGGHRDDFKKKKIYFTTSLDIMAILPTEQDLLWNASIQYHLN